MKKRIFAILVMVLIALAFIPIFSEAQVSSETTKFRFVVMPDTHVSCGKNPVPFPARKAVEVTLEKIKPAFVLHTGDMINVESGATKRSPCIDVMWSNFKKEIVDRFLAAQILFFPSAGNHDYLFGVSQRYKDEWSKYKNNGYPISGPAQYTQWYSFDYGNSHFISLLAPGSVRLINKKEQLAWLTKDLEEAKKKNPQHIFIFAHSPYYCPAMASSRCATSKQWLIDKELKDLAKQYNIKFIGGHMHVYAEGTADGVSYIIDGMLGGGKRKLQGKSMQPWQFLVIDVDGAEWKTYQIKAAQYDTTQLPEAPAVSSQTQFSSKAGPTAGVGGCPAGYQPGTATTSTGTTTGSTSPVTTASLTTSTSSSGQGTKTIEAQKGYGASGRAGTVHDRFTEDPTNCQLTIPPFFDSQSTGSVANGGLLNGFEFPVSTKYTELGKAYYQGTTPYRIRWRYCVNELATAFYRAACIAGKQYNKKMGFGDMSQVGGGPMIWTEKNGQTKQIHQTHQSGRSMDVWFYSKSRPLVQDIYGVDRKYENTCKHDAALNPDMDVAATWLFIKTFLESSDTKTILVNCRIIDALKEEAMKTAEGKAAWEKYGSVFKHHDGHADHFHIDIACPKGDTKCTG